jgi:hypothetical protein
VAGSGGLRRVNVSKKEGLFEEDGGFEFHWYSLVTYLCLVHFSSKYFE